MGWALPLHRLRQFVWDQRSVLRISAIWFERVGASTNAFDLPCSWTPLQSITAATSRWVPEPFLSRAVHARGRTPSGPGGGCAFGYRGFTRGWVPKIERFRLEQAHGVDARRGRIARRFSLALRSRPRPGADVFPPYGGGQSSERHRAASSDWQANQETRAPIRSSLARRRGPEPLGAFCFGLPDGVLDRKRRATGQAIGHRGGPKVASRGVPTEVGPGAQDTQREHNNTSHGVRFLSAR
jgi:hypothetical protein